jgi:hypothetical protein
MEFPKAVLKGDPYPVKGVLINGASTLINYPQPKIFEEAYRNLDPISGFPVFKALLCEIEKDIII